MKLETFFESFGQLAEAPNGVAKLRELILQLAVQGKLVPQDLNDEPASVLLSKIKAEKERLIQEKKIKKSEPLPPIEADEVPFNLPQGWEVARLGSICFESFYGPRFGKEEYSDSGIPTIRTTDMTDAGEIVLQNPPKVVVPKDKLDLYKLEKEDLLITRTGSIGIMAIFRGDYLAIPSAYLIRFRFSRQISIDYLFYFLKSPFGQNLLGLSTNKQAQPNINASSMAGFTVFLPPLAEQGRIVAKVDQLMALCDELEARQQRQQSARVHLNNAALDRMLTARAPEEFAEHWQRICDSFDLLYDAPETVASLRQAILQLAVQGKLVPQDPNDEPASVLLNAVAAETERTSRKNSRNGQLPNSVDKQEVPFDTPLTWLICRFGDLAEIISGVTKGRNLIGRETAFFPYLRVANVQRGFLELDVMKEIEIPTHEIDKYRLIKNDIVITEGGDWDKVGRAAIWKEQIANCIHQNHVFRARLHSSTILPQWIILFMNSPVGRRYFEAASKQTTNLASINMGQLRSCPIPLPSTKEQHRIVAKVDQLMALCDELEAKLRQAQSHSAKLMTATVQHLAAA